MCNFINSTTHYHIVVTNESEAILQSVNELTQTKNNKCNQFIAFSLCLYLFRNCELRNSSDPSSGMQLSICQSNCYGLLRITVECLDDSDFRALLQNSNYNEEIAAWALNFNCYNPSTYGIPGVPISKTSCNNISFIDGLTSAGELTNTYCSCHSINFDCTTSNPCLEQSCNTNNNIITVKMIFFVALVVYFSY